MPVTTSHLCWGRQHNGSVCWGPLGEHPKAAGKPTVRSRPGMRAAECATIPKLLGAFSFHLRVFVWSEGALNVCVETRTEEAVGKCVYDSSTLQNLTSGLFSGYCRQH